jgi:hypothetical protein
MRNGSVGRCRCCRITTTSGWTGVAYIYVRGTHGWPTTPTGTLAGADAPRFVSVSGSVVVFGEYKYHSVKGIAKIFEL